MGSDRRLHIKKRFLAFTGLILSVIVPVVLLLLLRSEVSLTPLTVGQRAPRVNLLTFPNQTNFLLGGSKQAVLFFTVECSHCQRELLNFEELSLLFGKQMSFVGVSLSDHAETTDLVRAKTFSFPLIIDIDKRARKAYHIASVPALFLISENGILLKQRTGEASLDADKQLLVTFLNEPTKVSTQ